MAETFTPTTFANINGQVTSAVTALNTNFAGIATLLEDVVSLSGNSPNSMQSNFDMNSNRILNLPTPIYPEDVIRLQDLPSPTLVNVATNLASDPLSPVMGQFYWNTGSLSLRIWNGTAWKTATLT